MFADYSKLSCPIDTAEMPTKQIKIIEPSPSTSKPATTKFTSAKEMFRKKFQGSPESRGAFLKCGKVNRSKHKTLGSKKFNDPSKEQNCENSDSLGPMMETEYRDIINRTGEKLMNRSKRKKNPLVQCKSGNQ